MDRDGRIHKWTLYSYLGRPRHESVVMTEPTMAVTFLNGVTELGREDSVSFGRDADICVDELNTSLHRVAGRVFERDGWWYLENLGSRMDLVLSQTGSSRSTLLPSGMTCTLIDQHWTVRFTAGPCSYELTGSLSHAPLRAHEPGSSLQPETSSPRLLPVDFSQTEREVLLVLCQLHPAYQGQKGVVPADKEIASVLGVGPKAVDNALGRVTRKLRETGRLEPERGDGVRLSRRQVIVDVVTSQNLLSQGLGAGSASQPQ